MRVNKTVCTKCWEEDGVENKISSRVMEQHEENTDEYWNEFDYQFQEEWDSRVTVCVELNDDDCTTYCKKCFAEWAAEMIIQLEGKNE